MIANNFEQFAELLGLRKLTSHFSFLLIALFVDGCKFLLQILIQILHYVWTLLLFTVIAFEFDCILFFLLLCAAAFGQLFFEPGAQFCVLCAWTIKQQRSFYWLRNSLHAPKIHCLSVLATSFTTPICWRPNLSGKMMMRREDRWG